MEVDTSFASLLERLKMEDPWLPPRPWESIPSESGFSHSTTSTSQSSPSIPLYDTCSVSEASLVRLAMNALQGIESALISVEKICAAFFSDPADRTFHRIPSLWNRSLSTVSLGKILKSIGRLGCVVFLLRKFVDYFTNLNLDGNSIGNEQVKLEMGQNQNDCDMVVAERPPYSLVNQAFAVAVGKVLNGYISALDTVYASVGLRRLSNTDEMSSHSTSRVGCLTSVGHSEITLLEAYLHTEGLRTQIDVLGNICNVHDVALCFSVSSSFEDLSAKANLEFSDFPRGGDLLSFLYTQLKVADPVHCALLKFLFLRSCEPYCEFIRSWIYKAKINDPYKEFIVDYIPNPPSYSLCNAEISIDFPLATIRDGVAVPCFLKDFAIPLFRAGQQLQVLIKLVELCNNVGTWSTYEDILPFWSGLSSSCPTYASPLTFNKGSIEAMVLSRNNYYKRMLEKLENVLTKLELRYQQVVPHGTVPIFFNNSGRSLNITVSCAVDNSSISPMDERNQNLPIGAVDSESSSMIDAFSCVEDPFESSEFSSINSSDEQSESEQLIQLDHGITALEQKYLSALSFSSSINNNNSLQKPSQSKISCATESDLCEQSEGMDLAAKYVHIPYKGMNLRDNSLPIELGESHLSWNSELQDAVGHHDLSWPVGGLLKNPFYVDRGDVDPHMIGGLKTRNRNMGSWQESNLIISKNARLNDGTNKDQYPNRSCASSNSFSLQSWNLKSYSNYLSMNPILAKNFVVHHTKEPGERIYTDYRGPPSFFDFTSVKDPCRAYMEKLADSPRHQFGVNLSGLTDYGVLAAIVNGNCPNKERYNDDQVSVGKMKLSNVYSPLGSKGNNGEDELLENVSGGSGWESMLGNSGNTAGTIARDQRMNLAAVLEIPLDFVIEKCLLEEILLQYRYVSKLTLKFLEEGFNLQEHLLALRRYHFMELADWADLFIMSLWHHKWYVTEADKRLSEIQGLLEMSVQRSSCERDHNKDRLFVYMKGHGMMPLSASASGIRSFDFLGLGYRVEWPVSIVLTPGALKIYSEIFTFLIQVKLAAFSLTDIWCSLKDLMHLINQNRHSELYESEVRHFNILMKIRHQVNHFVSTVQQYVQSQLSHVSWCRFQYSLKHKVKDMMDLESVHMAYLNESLDICFLSDETRSIASIIEGILQCALDFRSCLIGSAWEAGLDEGDLLRKFSQINMSQVHAIKATFDKNIKELYVCYLKSAGRGEFGLSRFWDYLNYNEYYSEVIGKEIGHCVFSF